MTAEEKTDGIRERSSRRIAVAKALSSVFGCRDAAHIVRVYTKQGSFDRMGFPRDQVRFVVEVGDDFLETDLRRALSHAEEECEEVAVSFLVGGKEDGDVLLWQADGSGRAPFVREAVAGA